MVLSVSEIFPSFQGEGINTGLPTTFIRLAGCNLNCLWCDTPYALDTEQGDEMDIPEIMAVVREIGIDRICLTGGEPLVQEEALTLVEMLIHEGFKVDLETNGSFDISRYTEFGSDIMISMDIKTPSSGEDGSTLMENLNKMRSIDQIKFIVKDKKDMEFTFKFLLSSRPDCTVILTPVDNKGGDLIAERLMDFIRNKIPFPGSD